MSKYRKCLLELLSSLNEGKSKEAQQLIDRVDFKHEVEYENGRIVSLIINDERKGYHINIAYVYNRILGKYDIITARKERNLFNCDPWVLIGYAITSRKTHKLSVTPIKGGKKRIVVMTSDELLRMRLERARNIYNVKAAIINITSIMELYEKGYRFFITDAVDGETLTWLREHPEVKVIMPTTMSNNLTSSRNLLKMNCVNDYMLKVTARLINTPTLFIHENNEISEIRAKNLASLLPGSKVVSLSDDIDISPYRSVYLSFDTIVPDMIEPVAGVTYWASEHLQRNPFMWKVPLHGVSIYYPNTVRNDKMFKHMSMEEYLYVEAMYYMHNYIQNGHCNVGGLTGVCEFDNYGNRLWFSFMKMTLVDGMWTQNYITEIPPNA